MRACEILTERLVAVIDLPSRQKVKVHQNATLLDFRMLLDQWREMRGFMNDKEFWIFDAHRATHPEICDALGLDIKDMFLWSIEDDPESNPRNISRTNTRTKFDRNDDYVMFEFMKNHPRFSRIAKSGLFTFFDGEIEADEV